MWIGLVGSEMCIRDSLKDAEDEFVDDSGYTVSSHKTLDRSISSADIESVSYTHLTLPTNA